MRVISGQAKSIPLMTPKGMDVRPTTDRIKETLFNMISPAIRDSRFLDIFAGSGQIGIEALSRGADSAVFIDSGRSAISCINANLEKCHFTDRATVISSDVRRALETLHGGDPFDIIFMDPPYAMEGQEDILRLIDSLNLLADDGMIIVEADIQKDFGDDLPFRLTRIKDYKTNQHLFYEY